MAKIAKKYGKNNHLMSLDLFEGNLWKSQISHPKSGASQVSKPSRYDLVRNNLIVDRKAGSKLV